MADDNDKNKFGEEAGKEPSKREREEISRRLLEESHKRTKEKLKESSSENKSENKKHKETQDKLSDLIKGQEKSNKNQTNANNYFKQLDDIKKANQQLVKGQESQSGLLKNVTSGLKTGVRRAGRVSDPFKALSGLVQTVSSIKKGATGLAKGAISTGKGIIDMPKKIMGIKGGIESKFRSKKIEKLKIDINKEKSVLSAAADEIKQLEDPTSVEDRKRKAKLIKLARSKQRLISEKSEELAPKTAKEFLYQKGKQDPKRFGKRALGEEGELLQSKLQRDIGSSLLKDVKGKQSLVDSIIRGRKGVEAGTSDIESKSRSTNIMADIIGGKGRGKVKGSAPMDAASIGKSLASTKVAFSAGASPTTLGQYIAGTYYHMEKMVDKLSNLDPSKPVSGGGSKGGGIFSKLLGAGLVGALAAPLLKLFSPLKLISKGLKLGVSGLKGAFSGLVTGLGKIPFLKSFLPKGGVKVPPVKKLPLRDPKGRFVKDKLAKKQLKQQALKQTAKQTAKKTVTKTLLKQGGKVAAKSIAKKALLAATGIGIPVLIADTLIDLTLGAQAISASMKEKKREKASKAKTSQTLKQKYPGITDKEINMLVNDPASASKDPSFRAKIQSYASTREAASSGLSTAGAAGAAAVATQQKVSMDTGATTGDAAMKSQEVLAELISVKMVEKLKELLVSDTYANSKTKEIRKTANVMNSATFGT